ncbi:hypothetical protein OPIT5_06300 [Opitutaceae bacterium TAV5]|nr:hypothetical protein OPIT5_06300 [Opitutaceae bacterium TAV5]
MDTLEQDDAKGIYGFFRKRAVLLSLAALAVGGVVALAFRFSSGGKPAPRPAPEVSVVRVALPPPPPPPPPPPRPEPQPRPEDTPVNPQEMTVAEPTPEAPVEAPDNAPASDAPDAGGEAMGTNIQGDGSPNAFGLAGSGHGGIIGGTGSGFGPRGGGGGSRWGAYNSRLSAQIQRALLNHKKTRSSELTTVVRLWVEGGRVVRAELAESTGDPDLDRALQSEVLVSLNPGEAPADMPQPIVLRLTGQRSH